MIIDFRYHVASLVAVFLALGVGILIGGVVIGNSALQKELGQIQADLAKLRSDQRALDAELGKREEDLRIYRQFGAAVVPALVREKLLGKRIALVRTNPRQDPRLAKDLTRLFQSAGATVSSVTTFLRDPAELAPDTLASLVGRLGLEEREVGNPAEEVLRVAIDRIVNGPIYGEDPGKDAISLLGGARLIEADGDYKGMVDILVLIGGSQDPAFDTSKRIDRVFLDTVAGAKGLLVAAVEPAGVNSSYLSEYLRHPVIVVDNVDSPPGQVALVFALVRGKKGHYGVKGADQLLPEVS